ncbi:TolC family outer membrane protein [Neptunomonas marina]|nr:TolC family outer membrane protein [Neptunomonas marina]
MLKRKLLALAITVAAAQQVSAGSLAEVVAEAVIAHPEVKAALYAKQAAEQEIAQAKGGYLPSVDIAAGIGYEWTRNPTTDSRGDGDADTTRREAALSIRQMLFDGSRTKSEVARFTAKTNALNYRVKEVAEEKALEIARAYLEVLKREELYKQANESYYSHVKVFDQIRRRSESGLGARSAVDQAQGRLALSEVNLLAAENNLQDAKATYLKVAGSMPPTSPEAPENISGLPGSSEEAVKIALDNHPTLRVAQRDIEEAQAQYRAAKSAMLPTVTFEVDRTWNHDIDGVDGHNEDLTAMVRMRYNLFNGGSDKARIQQTLQEIDQAVEIQSNAHRQTVEAVELSWNAYEILGKQLPFLEQHVESSAATRTSYEKQFNIGQRSLLDLLDTENEVFAAKNAFISGKYDYLIAQYRLLNGMGEILDVMGVKIADSM